jgi:DNA-binding NtrC family response regulator
VLQEKEFLPVGESTPRRTTARILAATNKNLHEEAALGRFREDLYYRLTMFVVEVPPLRRRREDIDHLVAELLDQANERLGKHLAGFSPEALAQLRAHSWPGNIRELKNVVDRAAILCAQGWIGPDLIALPAPMRPAQPPGAIQWPERLLPLEEVERAYIAEVLRRMEWRKNATADALGMGRSTLDRKIALYGLAPEDGR